ncbi:MAG: LPS export ABC transporter periplasmic protein LptC [Alloprevotella sp.]|nr:LPS export ABC transporter periplasmic protein LptC [Alloprevotella sp.]
MRQAAASPATAPLRTWLPGCLLAFCLLLAGACSDDAPPMSRLEALRDSIPVMTTHGVSKLVTDSGRVKYRIIAEEWRMFDKTKPPRQEFPKGLFLERFDKDFRMNMYITADSAWCFDQSLWRLKGGVVIIDKENATTFRTEELFWDMREHRFYSSRHMHIIKPDRELQGDRFTANEQLTKYHVWQSKGFMPMPEDHEDGASNQPSSPANNTQKQESDTTKTA